METGAFRGTSTPQSLLFASEHFFRSYCKAQVSRLLGAHSLEEGEGIVFGP